MDKLEYVIKRLSDKAARAEAVFVTGVSTRTISYIMNRQVTPHDSTINALYSHFKAKGKK